MLYKYILKKIIKTKYLRLKKQFQHDGKWDGSLELNNSLIKLINFKAIDIHWTISKNLKIDLFHTNPIELLEHIKYLNFIIENEETEKNLLFGGLDLNNYLIGDWFNYNQEFTIKDLLKEIIEEYKKLIFKLNILDLKKAINDFYIRKSTDVNKDMLMLMEWLLYINNKE